MEIQHIVFLKRGAVRPARVLLEMRLCLMAIHQRDLRGSALDYALRVDPEGISGRRLGRHLVGNLGQQQDENKDSRNNCNRLHVKRAAWSLHGKPAPRESPVARLHGLVPRKLRSRGPAARIRAVKYSEEQAGRERATLASARKRKRLPFSGSRSHLSRLTKRELRQRDDSHLPLSDPCSLGPSVPAGVPSERYLLDGVAIPCFSVLVVAAVQRRRPVAGVRWAAAGLGARIARIARVAWSRARPA